MGKQSTRENKTIYQLCREEKELTREKASELMAGVSSSGLKKLNTKHRADSLRRRADGGLLQTPRSLQLLLLPKAPSGSATFRKWKSANSPILSWRQLPVSEINPLTNRLIQIARDGKISDDEIKDFAFISQKLDEISLAVDSLNLWVDKTASENDLNVTLLREEKERLKKQK